MEWIFNHYFLLNPLLIDDFTKCFLEFRSQFYFRNDDEMAKLVAGINLVLFMLFFKNGANYYFLCEPIVISCGEWEVK